MGQGGGVAQPEQQARQEIDRLLIAAGWRVFDLAEADIHAARGVAIYVEPRKLALGSVQPNLNLNPVRTIRFGKPITASISASNFTNRVKAGVLE